MKYQYLVVDQDLRGLPEGSADIDQMPTLLNSHGARGWQLDRFWDSDDGTSRFFLLRKDMPRVHSTEGRVLSF